MGLSLKCSHCYMKAIDFYYSVCYTRWLTFGSASEILKCGHLNESHCLSWTLLCVLFKKLYKVALIFECVDKIYLKSRYSNESYWAVLSCGTVDKMYNDIQGASNFKVWKCYPKMSPFKRNLTSNTFPWSCIIMLNKVIQTSESVYNWILQ